MTETEAETRSNREDDDELTIVAVQVEEQEAAMWEAEGAGFLRLDFDAVTQRRRRVATNDTASWQFGMRREEALARFAVGDIALPYTDIDVLRYFVVELGRKALLLTTLFTLCPLASIRPSDFWFPKL